MEKEILEKGKELEVAIKQLNSFLEKTVFKKGVTSIVLVNEHGNISTNSYHLSFLNSISKEKIKMLNEIYVSTLKKIIEDDIAANEKELKEL